MMEDNLSVKSSDSVTTSGEYEIVSEGLDPVTTPLGTSPTLNIANNGDIRDLEKNLNEVIHELDGNSAKQSAVAGPNTSISAPSSTTNPSTAGKY